MYYLGPKSQEKLKGVHPKLVQVVQLAIQKSSKDFSVNEGLRSLERQHQLLAKGATTTLNSKHIKQQDGYGHAVDLIPYPLSWDLKDYYPIAQAMREAAKELNVQIRWGGCWTALNNTTTTPEQLVLDYSKTRRSQGKRAFIDGPHFELV